jgi:hypothetical protein
MKIFSDLVFKTCKILKKNHAFITKSDYSIIIIRFIPNCFFLV